MIVPPKTSTIACKPRHTPKIGFLPAYLDIISLRIPASSGIPGPGDNIIISKMLISSIEISSFLTTVGYSFVIFSTM